MIAPAHAKAAAGFVAFQAAAMTALALDVI
jgi:hypothetical protein